MKAPSKQSWALMSVLLAAFWVFPLIPMWVNRLSDTDHNGFIVLLVLAFPLLTLVDPKHCRSRARLMMTANAIGSPLTIGATAS